MKVEMIEDKIIIYVKKYDLDNIDFNNIKILESYFQKLIIKLSDIYNIKICGFYNIKVYIDKIYGIVLELEKENIDYGDCFNQVEMRIIPVNTYFLYKIEDILNIKNCKYYLYNNDLYLKLPSSILKKDYYKVMDHALIVYNNTDNIIRYGRQLNHFNFKKIML